jgi:hypothetical protein
MTIDEVRRIVDIGNVREATDAAIGRNASAPQVSRQRRRRVS